MEWIGCVRGEKSGHDFVARTFALLAPVQPVLHRVNYPTKTIPNAPEHYENAPKHKFRVLWIGSGVLVAKNSYATSWHKLLF